MLISLYTSLEVKWSWESRGYGIKFEPSSSCGWVQSRAARTCGQPRPILGFPEITERWPDAHERHLDAYVKIGGNSHMCNRSCAYELVRAYCHICVSISPPSCVTTKPNTVIIMFKLSIDPIWVQRHMATSSISLFLFQHIIVTQHVFIKWVG